MTMLKTKFIKNILPISLEAFFLDFDGVVVESTNIKTEAFYEVYVPYGEDIAKMAKEYHLAHQGITRFIKFREIHKRFLGKACDEYEQARLNHAFSEIVLEKVLTCPLVDGIIEFLEASLTKNIPVFLLSATPHEELLTIVDNRGLSPFFKEVHGAPRTKMEIGRDLFTRYSFHKDQVVFIGDSLSDFTASKELETRFIGRQVGSSPVQFQDVPVIQTFRQLL